MAKISAYGAVKVADGAIDVTEEGADTIRYHFVLRSDGEVLRASSYPFAASAYLRKRSGYTLVGRVSKAVQAGGRDEMRLWMDQFLARKRAQYVNSGLRAELA